MPLQESDVLVRALEVKVDKLADDEVMLFNPKVQMGLAGSTALEFVVDYFKEPRPISDLMAEVEGVSLEVLDNLRRHHLLYLASEEPLFRHGLINVVPTSIGKALKADEVLKLQRLPHATTSFAVVGAPVDVAAGGEGGARTGPAAIRAVFQLRLTGLPRGPADPKDKHKPLPSFTAWNIDSRKQIDLATVDVVDVGNVTYVSGESVASFGARLAWVHHHLRERGFVPCTLGGDHSITRFALRSLLEEQCEPFGIVHFDAHTDLYEMPADIFSHGNPFDEALKSDKLRSLFQVGIRQFRNDRGEPVVDPRLRWVSARQVWRSTPEQVFADLPKDLPVYLTFDIDCMDPAGFPQTGTPVAGGLQYYDALECVEWLVQHRRLLGCDFVEVSGDPSVRNHGANLCAALLAEVITGHGKASELTSQLFRALGRV